MSGLAVDLPIETERLVLRAHRSEDLDDLAHFHSDPEVVRYVPWPVRDRASTAETLEAKLGQTSLDEHGQWLVLAVELRSTGTVIGEVLLTWVSDRQGELGFAFGRDHSFPRVSAVVVEGNDASTRLLGRLGFGSGGGLRSSRAPSRWLRTDTRRHRCRSPCSSRGRSRTTPASRGW